MCAQARRERDHKARASSKPSKPKYGGSATGSLYPFRPTVGGSTYDEIAKLVPQQSVLQNVREVSLNPNTPIIRGTGQRPDIFMQVGDASGMRTLAPSPLHRMPAPHTARISLLVSTPALPTHLHAELGRGPPVL